MKHFSSIQVVSLLFATALGFQPQGPGATQSNPLSVAAVEASLSTPLAGPSLDGVQDILSQLYGHERVRRLNAAMSKTNFLQANPHVDKRHMTYGELPLELFAETLNRIAQLVEGPGSFVDLGSGVGRLTIAAALLAPSGIFTDSKGIEIVAELHQSALEARDRAFSLLPGCALPLSFHLGDAFDPSNGLLSDASALYCYSTTWQCDINLVIFDLSTSLAQAMKPGSIVAMTDRKLASPFVLVDSFTGSNPEKGGPGATSIVNIYRLSL